MFKNSTEENRLLQTLQAYIEEWGPENVCVLLPDKWSRYADISLDGICVHLIDEDLISIRVIRNGQTLMTYDTHLAESSPCITNLDPNRQLPLKRLYPFRKKFPVRKSKAANVRPCSHFR